MRDCLENVAVGQHDGVANGKRPDDALRPPGDWQGAGIEGFASQKDTLMQMSREQSLQAYRLMRTIREFENCIHREFAKGTIPGFVHLSAGQEAAAVGVCMNLGDGDYIATTHRGHGHTLAKGCDLEEMMKEIFGKRDGLCGGKGGSMHIADVSKGMLGANAIVGHGAPLVCGAALTAKTLKTGAVAVVFLGDGACNEGVVMESLNLASIWRLPAIFVIEDNGYGQTTPASYAVAGDLVRRVQAFDIPAEDVDGYDFFAVHHAIRKVVARARAGKGPSALRLKLGRFYGHFEGDPQNYRPPGEVARLRKDCDCLTLFSKRVTEAALLSEAELLVIDNDVKSEIDRVVKTAKAAASPTAADLVTDVYVSY